MVEHVAHTLLEPLALDLAPAPTIQSTSDLCKAVTAIIGTTGSTPHTAETRVSESEASAAPSFPIPMNQDVTTTNIVIRLCKIIWICFG